MAKTVVKSTGKGMKNTFNRLNLHYKDKHILQIDNGEEIYKIKLVLTSGQKK